MLYGIPAVFLAGDLGQHVRLTLAAASRNGNARTDGRLVWSSGAWRLGTFAVAADVLRPLHRLPGIQLSAGPNPRREEPGQVDLARFIARSVLIGYLLWQAWNDAATLGRDSAAWPMVGVSLLYTIAYAFSITRYKLMQVEEIINRSVVYFAFSVTAGLDLFGRALGQRLADRRSASLDADLGGAMVAAISVIVVLILSEIARGRFQRVIDRQFFREKYKFDQAMQKMRLAVGSLVDRVTLGRRLLEGAVEVLRVEWGAVYLREPAENAHFTSLHATGPGPRSWLSRWIIRWWSS